MLLSIIFCGALYSSFALSQNISSSADTDADPDGPAAGESLVDWVDALFADNAAITNISSGGIFNVSSGPISGNTNFNSGLTTGSNSDIATSRRNRLARRDTAQQGTLVDTNDVFNLTWTASDGSDNDYSIVLDISKCTNSVKLDSVLGTGLLANGTMMENMTFRDLSKDLYSIRHSRDAGKNVYAAYTLANAQNLQDDAQSLMDDYFTTCGFSTNSSLQENITTSLVNTDHTELRKLLATGRGYYLAVIAYVLAAGVVGVGLAIVSDLIFREHHDINPENAFQTGLLVMALAIVAGVIMRQQEIGRLDRPADQILDTTSNIVGGTTAAVGNRVQAGRAALAENAWLGVMRARLNRVRLQWMARRARSAENRAADLANQATDQAMQDAEEGGACPTAQDVADTAQLMQQEYQQQVAAEGQPATSSQGQGTGTSEIQPDNPPENMDIAIDRAIELVQQDQNNPQCGG